MLTHSEGALFQDGTWLIVKLFGVTSRLPSTVVVLQIATFAR